MIRPLLTIPYVIFCLLIGTSNDLFSQEYLIEKQFGNSDEGLKPEVAPSENFDLSIFKLSLPSDDDQNGRSDNVSVKKLNAGYQSDYFYTGKDGGMVFKCPSQGAKTSKNTKYVRTELREMLRNGDKSISTKGVTKNNWVFSSAPRKDRKAAGAVDGEMKATLAINHVTTSGEKSQVGRLVIGQIHANTDEPIRLYYRKLKGNSLGSIYFAHELNKGDDTYYELIGSKSSGAKNPVDGIALNEKFTYEIKVIGNRMLVTIKREGKENVNKMVDMSGSGYDEGGQYKYFKAGIYHLNNTADDDDYAQATFYDLQVIH